MVIVVFGFAPGFCLRLIVLAYPRSDPRRTELMAELYAVPRIERPLWVAEQVEVALFEGLPHRFSAILCWFARRRRAQVQADKHHEKLSELRVGHVGGLMAALLGVLMGRIGVLAGVLVGGFAGVLAGVLMGGV